MSPADSLCFACNEIDSHFCPDCRAPMLVGSTSIGRHFIARKYACFNCSKVVVTTDARSKFYLNGGSRTI